MTSTMNSSKPKTVLSLEQYAETVGEWTQFILGDAHEDGVEMTREQARAQAERDVAAWAICGPLYLDHEDQDGVVQSPPTRDAETMRREALCDLKASFVRNGNPAHHFAAFIVGTLGISVSLPQLTRAQIALLAGRLARP